MGAEADGDSTQGSATLARGSPGVLHGTRTYLLQDEETGQVQATHSISAGLDYPGVGPEHAFLKDSGRASYEPINNDEALAAFQKCASTDGHHSRFRTQSCGGPGHEGRQKIGEGQERRRQPLRP